MTCMTASSASIFLAGGEPSSVSGCPWKSSLYSKIRVVKAFRDLADVTFGTHPSRGDVSHMMHFLQQRNLEHPHTQGEAGIFPL